MPAIRTIKLTENSSKLFIFRGDTVSERISGHCVHTSYWSSARSVRQVVDGVFPSFYGTRDMKTRKEKNEDP